MKLDEFLQQILTEEESKEFVENFPAKLIMYTKFNNEAGFNVRLKNELNAISFTDKETFIEELQKRWKFSTFMKHPFTNQILKIIKDFINSIDITNAAKNAWNTLQSMKSKNLVQQYVTSLRSGAKIEKAEAPQEIISRESHFTPRSRR